MPQRRKVQQPHLKNLDPLLQDPVASQDLTMSAIEGRKELSQAFPDAFEGILAREVARNLYRSDLGPRVKEHLMGLYNQGLIDLREVNDVLTEQKSLGEINNKYR